MYDAAYYAGFNLHPAYVTKLVWSDRVSTHEARAVLPVWGWSSDQWDQRTHHAIWHGDLWGCSLYDDRFSGPEQSQEESHGG